MSRQTPGYKHINQTLCDMLGVNIAWLIRVTPLLKSLVAPSVFS